MPFGKGRTANRRGPPRSYETFAAIFEDLLRQPTNAPPPEQETNKQRMARAQVEKAKQGSGDSFDRIANRTEGKVPDVLNQNVSGQLGHSISDDTAKAVLRRLLERQSQSGGGVGGAT